MLSSFARISLYALLILMAVLEHVLSQNFINWDLQKTLYGVGLVGLILQLGYFFSADWMKKNPSVLKFTFFIDVILIGLALFKSELNPALFLMLYLINIMISGLTFQTRGALEVASFTSMTFSLISILSLDFPGGTFIFSIVLNNLSFFLVAWISGYLSDQVYSTNEKLKAQNLSIKAIRKLNEMIVETIPSALLSVTAQGEVLQFNQGALGLFSREELAGLSIKELLPALASDFSTWDEGKKVEVNHEKDGTQYFLSVQVRKQIGETFSEPTFLLIIEDQTQVKRLESVVRQSEKMAAIGQLAAGIAHEIRNPLASISGSVEMLSQQYVSQDDQKLSKIILKEIDRLNGLISEFLDYAKPEKAPSDLVDFSRLVIEVVESLKPQFKGAEVLTKVEPKIQVKGFEGKLKQALMNILINSYQAIEKTQTKKIEVSLLFVNGKAELLVTDTGCGMTEETRLRMFEPFLTTKSKGTGLGLAITHKIFEVHNAKVFVQSEVGLGTKFFVSFPSI